VSVQRRMPQTPAGKITYRARVRSAGGKECSKSFRRKADAERWEAEQKSLVARGTWTDPARGRVRTSAWATTWLDSLGHLKPKTMVGYESLLKTKVLPRWGTTPLADIDHSGVASWITGLHRDGLSASRTRQAYNVLTAMLDAAVRDRRLGRNAARGVRLPRIPRSEVTPLKHHQVMALAEAAGKRAGSSEPLILVLAFCGLRLGEAAALTVERIDFDRRRIHIARSLADVNGKLYFGPPKTHEDRYVPMPNFVAEQLKQLTRNCQPHTLVFRAPRGGVLRYGNWRRNVFDPARRAAGLEERVTPHVLRHTCASILITTGASPRAIMEYLGHSSIDITMDRYGHLYGDEMGRLAADLDTGWTVARAAYLRPSQDPQPDGAAA